MVYGIFRRLVCLFSVPLFAWQAPLTLVDAGTLCDGRARVVAVELDVTGLVYAFGDAGLNAFVVTLNLDRTDIQIGARPGTTPDQDWQIESTDADLVILSQQITIVGWAPDANAPNTKYRICELIVSGGGGNLTVSVNEPETSFATRSLGTISAGSIPFTPPPPLTVALSDQPGPALNEIIEAWDTDTPEFDLVNPTGLVDVADLTQLINCGAS